MHTVLEDVTCADNIHNYVICSLKVTKGDQVALNLGRN